MPRREAEPEIAVFSAIVVRSASATSLAVSSGIPENDCRL